MRTFAIGMVVLTAIVGSAFAQSNPPPPLPDLVRITDSAPDGEERLYPSFSAAAAEAGKFLE